MRPCTWFLLGLFAAAPCLAADQAPVNSAATPKTREVLRFIQSLETRSEHRILSGQFLGYVEQRGSGLPEKIYTLSGQWPALIGVDYADHIHGIITHRTQNANAIHHWRAGSLITVSAHMYNPANPKGGGLRDKGVDLKTLLEPGTPTSERWQKQLDEMADGLQELRDQGVVVLWRPFHEMNGDWFWWGDKDRADFVRVWRHMFDYYSRTRKLDNLLWVYGPNHGPKAESNADEFYPGDDYVDIIGFDAYTDHVDASHIFGYSALAARPKPFGFSEFGPHGPQNPPGDFDCTRWISGVEKDFPRTTYILFWDDKWSPANNLKTREFFNHPSMLNRDQLPAGLTGKTLK